MSKTISFAASSLLLFFLAHGFAVAQISSRSSVHTSGTESDHFSFRAAVSADGRYVAFHSRASNLITGDTNGEDDVFVHDHFAGVTVRVSVSSSGVAGNSDSRDPSISSTGRFVTFRSLASNLVPDDGNSTWDIFVHDRDADGDGIFDEPGAIVTERVSVDSAGVEADGSSYSSSVSADGRFVAFDSAATNLAGADPNALDDIFVRDRQLGATVRASVDSLGIPADNGGAWPSISADGRYVAFESLANNLVAGDTNLKSDIFVRDLQGGTTVRVSVDSSGGQSDDTSLLFDTHHAISGDGRFVVFSGRSSILVPGDTNGNFDAFVHDRDADGDGLYDEAGAISTFRASVDSSGVEALGGSSEHANISDDGRYVAFDSSATNLVPGGNSTRDIYVRDIFSGTTTQASVDSDGVTANNSSTDPTVSNGGRVTVFHSSATNLVAVDGNGRDDIFVRGSAQTVCLDARGSESEFMVFREPPGGCPVSIGATPLDFIRGQTQDLSVFFTAIRLDPTRCAGGGLATTAKVVTSRDIDLDPGQARLYLWRFTGDPDFGAGSSGFPRVVTTAISCP